MPGLNGSSGFGQLWDDWGNEGTIGINTIPTIPFYGMEWKDFHGFSDKASDLQTELSLSESCGPLVKAKRTNSKTNRECEGNGGASTTR